MPNIEGAFSAEEIEGKLNIILKLDVKNQSANELAETIAHELALHGSDLDKIIKTYEKDGIEAVKKLFASDPDGDMDHKSLAKQDKKHTGVSNYNQVKREMIKKYPSTKKFLIVSKRNMRKSLVIKKIALIMIVASLLMPLSSCHGNRKRLSSNEESSFLITYSQKEIVIESIKRKVLWSIFFIKMENILLLLILFYFFNS